MPGGSWCCCGCFAWTDIFDRTPSTDIGSNWNETTGVANGDWEIIEYPPLSRNGCLHEKAGETPTAGTNTANAIVFCTQAVPSHSDGEMHITVEVYDPSAGDKYIIYPCCKDDHTLGDLSVRFTYSGSPSFQWLIEILSGSTLLESILTSEGPDDDGKVTLGVCADSENEQILAYCGTLASVKVWEDTDPGLGRYAAIGHNNTDTGAIFDIFLLEELRRSDETVCVSCWCVCNEEGVAYNVPKRLLLTFYADPDLALPHRGDCMEKVSIVLDWTSSFTWTEWYGEGVVTATDDASMQYDVYAALRCAYGMNPNPSIPGSNFTLAIGFRAATGTATLYPHELCGGHPDTHALFELANVLGVNDETLPINSSCYDPLQLIFGRYCFVNLDCYICYAPFDLTVPTGCFYAVVTENPT
jgi:hypothetical protein